MLLDYLQLLQAAPAPATAPLGGYSEDPRFFRRGMTDEDLALALLLGSPLTDRLD